MVGAARAYTGFSGAEGTPARSYGYQNPLPGPAHAATRGLGWAPAPLSGTSLYPSVPSTGASLCASFFEAGREFVLLTRL